MPEYYDDNFGHWEDMHEPENREFYRQVQRESVWKRCSRCNRKVKLRKEYSICNTCADKIEKGWDF